MTDVVAKPLRPADWVAGFALLILCQLAGETLVQILRLIVPAFAFPGPVIGMLLLVGLLALMGDRARPVIASADGLLGILSLLFVPSAVGIMQHGELIRAWGGPLLLAVVASTALTLVVTVGVFILTERWMSR
ncbi:CidA/LrgA family protein [Devosia sp.]|uniref:CidA/LrgA family protein n=1 Tax=Devosia sp. TaxID=1871048 RepID=UPI001AD2F84A|nr:CidA/LrgA family protein [Devosia sp.]MBN9335101.1 CidA/LrgA family protein [Devosia sp.]